MQHAKLSALLLCAVVSVTSAGCGCTTVPPGYVGIRVNLYGNQRGVEDFPIETGRIWYNAWTEDVHKFPTYMQNVVWTRDPCEGSPTDESITFNSTEGAVINCDVGMAYQIEADKVPHIFVELRKDVDYITDTYVRSKVRDAFSKEASTMKVTDIFGPGKQRLLTAVKQDLDNDLKPDGFNIDMVSFIGGLRVDPKVESAINATIEATQRAIEAQNKVIQIKAEADQAVERSRGMAESIRLEANAKAAANRTLTESLSQPLLTYEALQKWNGTMPLVVGETGAMPFIQIAK